ncbi:MAG: hypothetical protein HRU03_08975, partial [Nanoarchaeales archaeon]|nr:hypothetical protein [Nanoarchaeales archaeon]
LLKYTDVEDYIFEDIKTVDFNYTDYKKDDLSDLTIDLFPLYDSETNSTELLTYVYNRGDIPAFNVFYKYTNLNSSNSSEKQIPTLNRREVVNTSEIFLNSNISWEFSSQADFRSLIEEYNETNNFIISKSFSKHLFEVVKLFRNIRITEGESYIIDIDKRNESYNLIDFTKLNISLLNSGTNISKTIIDENITRFTLTTKIGDSGCDYLGQKFVAVELVEISCSAIDSFSLNFDYINDLFNYTFFNDIYRSIYNAFDGEIYFNKSSYDESENLTVFWNTKGIPYNIISYRLFNNKKQVFEDDGFIEVEPVKELDSYVNPIDLNGTYNLSKDVKQTFHSYLPFDLNYSKFGLKITGESDTAVNMGGLSGDYLINGDTNVGIIDDDSDVVYGGDEGFSGISLGGNPVVDCSQFCSLSGDTYTCTGSFSCNVFETDKHIVFDSVSFSLITSGNYNPAVLKIKTNKSLSLLNSNMIIIGGSAGNSQLFINGNSSILIFNTDITLNGGNGQKSNDYCRGGGSSNLFIGTHSRYKKSNLIILDSNFNLNSGRPLSNNEDGHGCNGGSSSLIIKNIFDFNLSNSNFDILGNSGSGGNKHQQRVYGGKGGSSSLFININNNLFLDDLMLILTSGNGNTGHGTLGGNSGSSNLEIYSKINISILNSQISMGTGVGGSASSTWYDGNIECGDAGNSGLVKLNISSNTKLKINSSVFGLSTGISGQGFTNNNCYGKSGDTGNILFNLKSDDILLLNLNDLNLKTGNSGFIRDYDHRQRSGYSGGIIFEIFSYENFHMDNSNLYLKTGTTYEGDIPRSTGSIKFNLDVKNDILFNNNHLSINTGRPGKAHNNYDSDWMNRDTFYTGASSGSINLIFNNSNEILFNNSNFNIYTESGSDSIGNVITTGSSGDLSLEINTLLFYLVNSEFNLTSGVLQSGGSENEIISKTHSGHIRFNLNSPKIIFDNGKLNLETGRVLSTGKGKGGSIFFNLNSYSNNLLNNSLIFFKKGNVYSGGYGSANILNFNLKDLFIVDNTSFFTFENVNEKPKLTYNPDLNGRL